MKHFAMSVCIVTKDTQLCVLTLKPMKNLNLVYFVNITLVKEFIIILKEVLKY